MKTITMRKYMNVYGITEDYRKVRRFLIKRGYCEFTYGRWDWMITHPNLEENNLSRIGLWEEEGELVGLVTFDTEVGETFLITLPGYECLKREMVSYAEKEFAESNNFGIMVSDDDEDAIDLLASLGYVATPEKEMDAIFYPEKTSTEYTLKDGFKITDLEQTYDLRQYERVLWKGFDHEINGEGFYDGSGRTGIEGEGCIKRENVNLALKIAAMSPEGNFVAFCGMWYDRNAEYAIIEPVATDPDYRKMGFGKAVVLEGIKRAVAMGAKYAVVGSSQQFYYSIGLRPYKTSTMWKKHVDSNVTL